MTLDTWVEKYYNKDVLAELWFLEATDSSILRAVNHCLLKWKGFLCLKEHGLHCDSTELVEDNTGKSISMASARECALCTLVPKCEGCVIRLVHNGFTCFQSATSHRAPYSNWLYAGNPKPMIRLLEKCKKYLEDRIAKSTGPNP